MRTVSRVNAYTDGFWIKRLDSVGCLGSDPRVLLSPEQQQRNSKLREQIIDVYLRSLSVLLYHAVEDLSGIRVLRGEDDAVHELLVDIVRVDRVHLSEHLRHSLRLFGVQEGQLDDELLHSLGGLLLPLRRKGLGLDLGVVEPSRGVEENAGGDPVLGGLVAGGVKGREPAEGVARHGAGTLHHLLDESNDLISPHLQILEQSVIISTVMVTYSNTCNLCGIVTNRFIGESEAQKINGVHVILL